MPGEVGLSRVEALARAIRGDDTLLTPAEAAGLTDKSRTPWALARMAELIDAEVAGLRAHRETLDLGRIAGHRALTPDLALFDASKAGQLARRYEAEAERGFFRALRELRRRDRDEAPRDRDRPAEPAITPQDEARASLLGSFRAIEATGLVPGLVAPKPRPDPARVRPMPPSRRDRRAAKATRDPSSIVVGRG